MLGSHRGPTEWGLITPANQQNVLWQCILRDDAEVLRRLLTEFTVDINTLNKGGQTPLVTICVALACHASGCEQNVLATGLLFTVAFKTACTRARTVFSPI